jgi:hypothetical protein
MNAGEQGWKRSGGAAGGSRRGLSGWFGRGDE